TCAADGDAPSAAPARSSRSACMRSNVAGGPSPRQRRDATRGAPQSRHDATFGVMRPIRAQSRWHPRRRVARIGPSFGVEPDMPEQVGGRGRLEGWKEIAAYLRREVRTVQRWEKVESLPVHRQMHERRAVPYAYVHELDEWASSRETPTGAPSSRRGV